MFLNIYRSFVVMSTQFLVVLSTTLLTVCHKAYAVLRYPARGPAAGAHLVAIVANAKAAGGSTQRFNALRQHPNLTAPSEMLTESLICSSNVRAIAGENFDENCQTGITNELLSCQTPKVSASVVQILSSVKNTQEISIL